MKSNYQLKGLAAALLLLLLGIFGLEAAPSGKVRTQQVTISANSQPLKDVLSQIEKQTGYLFVVNDNVNTKEKVSIKADNELLPAVLDRLLKPRGIYYAIEGSSVVLTKNRGNAEDKGDNGSRISTITGTVFDNEGEPAIGASVRVDGMSGGVATDIDGKFVLNGNFTPQSKLEVSYVGMKPATMRAGTGKNLVFHLESDANVFSEVVAVGYGTQKRVNLTGAVATVDVDKQLNGRPVTNVAGALQGSIPGLSVTTSNGKPGSKASMQIRSALGSIQGSTEPLILVDNVEVNDLSLINPDDIEGISVLKDAASASIYGVRGAFGVILITTKKAKKGEKFTISYSDNFAWKSPTVKPELAVGSEGATLALLGVERSKGISSVINDIGMYWDWNTVDRMKEWERVYGGYNLSPELVYGRDYEKLNGSLQFYRSYDPYDLMMKKNSFMQQHNIAINGTSGNTSYNVGLGYMGNRGMMRVNNDAENRYTVSFGTRSQLKDWFEFHSKLMYTRTDTENPYQFNSTYDEFYYLYRWPATYPYGTINGEPIRNSISEREQANRNKITSNWMRISLGFSADIYKGLTAEADYTFTHVGRYTQTNGGSAEGYDFWNLNDFVYKTWTTAGNLRSAKGTDFSDYHVLNALIRYKWENETYGNIGAFIGTNIESYNNYGQSGQKLDLLLNDRPEISLGYGDMTAGSYNNKNTVAGFFGRLNYDFRGRYLLEANFRYDGSSKFPRNKRWTALPSFSAGWIVSNEKFMESLSPALTFFKVRASWGKIGSDRVANNLFLGVMSMSETAWIVGENGLYTLGMPRALRDGFTWEKVTTTDVGVDLRFLNSRLGVSFDWFDRKTTDLINTGASLPSSFGQTAPMTNYGHVNTRGWELAVDYRHNFSFGLGMSIAANISDAVGKYSNTDPNERRVDYRYDGKTYGEIWGYETDRLFTAADFTYDEYGNITGYAPGVASQQYLVDQYKEPAFQFGPGDVKYKDINGDGQIDDGLTNGVPTLDNHGDMKVIGNTTPRYQYGVRLDLTYRGFDAGIFFQGVGKRQMWGTGQLVIPGWHYGEAYYEHHMDYWTEENPDAYYPRPWALNYQNANPNFKKQSRYLLNMAYCRIKNLTVGYTLPENVSRKFFVSKLRVYASLENLHTWDHLNNVPIDPETRVASGDGGYIGRSYPFSKEYSFGLQLTF